MKSIKYILGMALAVVFALTSCSDFLEAENKSAGGQTADDYFTTEIGQSAWRTNTFFSLRKIVTSTDILENSSDLYWPSRGRGDDEFVRFSLTAETEAVQNFYVACYELINNANGLIYYAGDKYKTDAIFLRAYGYYMLTQQFGGVPYITEYINNSNRDYPRADLKTIYDGCIADLVSVYDAAPEKAATNDGSVNKRAIAALIAKLNLAAAWDLETTLTDAAQGKYTVTGSAYATEAAKWAETSIAGIALTQTFEKKWAPSNEDANPETFFSVQWDRASYPGTNGGHGLQNDFGSYYGDISATCMKSVGSTKVPSAKSLYLWDQGDERFAGTFMTTFYNTKDTWGTEGYYAYYNATDAQKAALPIAWLYAPYYTDKAAFEAQLTAMGSRFKTGLANVPHAYIMSNPVVAYKFNDDGTWEEDAAVSGTYNDATLQNRLNFTPAVKKWDDPNTAQSNGNSQEDYRDIVVFHASDLYLVAAEAYMLAGQDAKCLEKINAVRTRANAGTLASLAAYDPSYTHGALQMVDLVLDERARELYAEGQRYMDLRRTRQLVKYNVAYNNYITTIADMSNSAGEIKWYRPIPTTELSSNTSVDMKQNPGY
ncbi:MAG: RagB/SusD family nutrient uptake outer membrane protein [Prevotella sp.]|nr:RagB/SusD family nutrient uptake outer membrane protein [Prevotella sp.]